MLLCSSRPEPIPAAGRFYTPVKVRKSDPFIKRGHLPVIVPGPNESRLGVAKHKTGGAPLQGCV